MTDLVASVFECGGEIANVGGGPSVIVTDNDFEAIVPANCGSICDTNECEEREDHDELE